QATVAGTGYQDRILIEADPAIPPDEIKRHYKQRQILLTQRLNPRQERFRNLSEKNFWLVDFVDAHPKQESWKHSFRYWNRECKKQRKKNWNYSKPENFRRDAIAASIHLYGYNIFVAKDSA